MLPPTKSLHFRLISMTPNVRPRPIEPLMEKCEGTVLRFKAPAVLAATSKLHIWTKREGGTIDKTGKSMQKRYSSFVTENSMRIVQPTSLKT